MIKFLQTTSPKYPPRTYENASADATIAFAFNFNTAGEKLTRDAVSSQGKMYISVPPLWTDDDINRTIFLLNKVGAQTINIAGNGLYTTIQHDCDQAECDSLVYNFLYDIIISGQLKQPITLIRSGGQSGFDEAGLKAAVKLGIPALCLCPAGWKFCDENHTTICDEQKFKERFNGALLL